VVKPVLILCVIVNLVIAKALITESYGGRFTREELPTGEWETVEKAHFYENSIWVYSKADRKIVRYDTAGTFLQEVILPSVGRSNYLGEDFVVYDSMIVFLNSIDYQLELFSIAGEWICSVPFDKDHFNFAPLRSDRIINRIRVQDNGIQLGTISYESLFSLETGTFSASRSTRSAGIADSGFTINQTLYELHSDDSTITIQPVEER